MSAFHRFTTSLRRRPLALAALLAGAAGLGACSEDVEGGATCPVLCPGTEVPLQDTVLRSIVDTARTVPGIVVAGTEFALPLAFWRDTLETRVVVRYDALVEQFTPTGTTAADTTQRITRADSARLRVRFDRDASTLPDTFFVSAYDVDAVGAGEDTAAAVIESRLTPDRLLGTWGYGRASLAGDSLFLRISDSAVTARLTDPDTARRRMRIALVASAPSGKVILRVDAAPTAGGGSSPRLLYRPRNLATGKSDTLFRQSLPFSETPVGDAQTAGELADFAVVRVAPPPGGDPALLQVGGIPARRAYLQFDLDEDLVALLDSTTIVRAELRLVQVPSTLPDLLDTVKVGDVMTPRRDTVTLLPLVGVANNSVRDPARRAQLAVRAVRLIGAAGTPDSLFAPPLVLVPSGAGERVVDVTRLVRNWRRQSPDQPRYLVLAAGAEGQQPGALFFHPPSAGPALRPRLYVRYVPRVGYGIP